MEGKIVRWNDDRGFGFIKSENATGDIFAHISDFKQGYRRPLPGDSVSFEVTSENGKKRAARISLIGVKPIPQPKRSYIPTVINFLIFAVFAGYVYFSLIKPKLYPAYESLGFTCQGKTHCSQMTSCSEAKFYLANCPNVQIDGNNDGEPCERQLCTSSW